MKKFIVLAVVCLASFLVTACETFPVLPPKENLMKIKPGMKSGEIIKLFGEPQNISVAVCGMPPNQWTCTTWEYSNFIDGDASFTFSGEHNSLRLNNFNIDRY